jgi:hypothetical protein
MPPKIQVTVFKAQIPKVPNISYFLCNFFISIKFVNFRYRYLICPFSKQKKSVRRAIFQFFVKNLFGGEKVFFKKV